MEMPRLRCRVMSSPSFCCRRFHPRCDWLTTPRWCDVDVSSEEEMGDVYRLLTENYVEDDDNMFRFDYSRDFLQWALMPPGYNRDLHVGVRVKGGGRLVAFITGTPAMVRAHGKRIPVVEINFLCVHKKLRAHRLAPLLIKEITRRVNLTNVWQAVYTAGVALPRPVGVNQYWHRSLNPNKLIDIKFSYLGRNMTRSRLNKLYRLPKEPVTPGLRPMEPRDVEQVHALLLEYLEQFKLYQEFSVPEVAHFFLPRDGVIQTYVVENPETHQVTDFLSFYVLNSTITQHDKYNTLEARYSFYNVAKTVPLDALMKDALILAKATNGDVYNALDVMDNASCFKRLNFGAGDGRLHYYMYNWRCPQMEPRDVALVLM